MNLSRRHSMSAKVRNTARTSTQTLLTNSSVPPPLVRRGTLACLEMQGTTQALCRKHGVIHRRCVDAQVDEGAIQLLPPEAVSRSTTTWQRLTNASKFSRTSPSHGIQVSPRDALPLLCLASIVLSKSNSGLFNRALPFGPTAGAADRSVVEPV